jgi:hypothetical protein
MPQKVLFLPREEGPPGIAAHGQIVGRTAGVLDLEMLLLLLRKLSIDQRPSFSCPSIALLD